MLIRLRVVRFALLAISAAALVVLSPTAARADNGGIDPTYGTNGSTSLPANTTFNDAIKLADGSTVAVGSSGSGTTVEIVAKFTANGALDATFGTGGIVTIDVPGGTKDTAFSVTVRPAGGFVVAGTSDTTLMTDGGAITKLLANGTPDLTWGGTGTVVPGSGLAIMRGAHEDAIGTAVFAAEVNDGTFAIGRVDSAGEFAGVVNPSTWFTQLVLLAPAPAGVFNARLAGLTKLSTGEYVVVASGQRTDGSSEVAAFRFPAAGPGTGTLNSATVGARYSSAQPIIATHARVTAGDAVMVTGSIQSGATTTGALFRFNAASALDTTFGTAGLLTLPAASAAWTATDITRTSTGSWYVTGNLDATRVRTMRLTSGFVADPTFGDGAGIADRMLSTSGTRSDSIVVDAQDRPVGFGRFGTAATTYRIDLRDFASTQLGDITFTPSFVQRLKPVTWSFPVTNSGPDETGVTVDIDVPTTVESPTYSSTNGGTATPVADGTGVTWNIPQLAAGATATLTLTGRASDVGVITVGSTLTSQTAVRVGAEPTPKTSSVTVSGAATPRDDVIIGTPQRDVIDALAGNDKVYALADDDKVLGNDGNDYLDLGPGNDAGSGGAGDDTVIAGSGNDFVSGGTGNDSITAGTGNDYATGGAGTDLIRGNDGNDRLYGEDGNDRLEGGRGNDLVHGGAGADKLYGATGNDYLIGLTGNDLLVGGPGRDRVDGDGGNDKLYGNSGSDWLNGKTGNDVAYGGVGNDWLRGFTGNDFLVGQDGNDLLNGGLGADRLYGGVGNDIFRADDGKGDDYVNCGSGWDLVYANPGDIVTEDCEFVKYDVFAVAMP